jgi:hypothetical protein
VQIAWKTYLREKVAEGLLEDEKPLQGQEEATWKQIGEKVKEKDWKVECLKRDEKFDMRYTAAVCIYTRPLFSRMVHANGPRFLFVVEPYIQRPTCCIRPD